MCSSRNRPSRSASSGVVPYKVHSFINKLAEEKGDLRISANEITAVQEAARTVAAAFIGELDAEG